MADVSENIIIMGVMGTQFSIARFYGGIKINGTEYLYKPERDMLVRKDWDKVYRSLLWDDFIAAVKSGVKPSLKNVKKQKKPSATIKSLFDEE